ncbi:glycoside hydrolase family 65 protein [Pseudonocardia sp. HH130630-07]|uniref:glycoside hydrolase family 65 protein n=1 Tax=Pseudonocardia sp. HH130630-07 TaxID=1690815 RepID=UPI000814DD1C|nr:glycosyl hydrolase family 65 protein [Pseudonocardia sp. HH130630-07]ANY09295.1 glycoside hydrolase [Pseudonocardia sp. HH130630-07]
MSAPDPGWALVERGFDPAAAGYHETVMTVGNGRVGTRGALEEGHLGALSGTYLAGVYDAHDSPVVDLVNAPDWLDTLVRVDGMRLDVDSSEIVEHERVLDLRTGVLHRSTVFADPAGRRTRLRTSRTASMADRDLCLLQIEVTPLDHDAEIVIETGVDGRRRNLDRLPHYPDGLDLPPARRWDKWARSTHLAIVDRGFSGDGTAHLVTGTIDSGVRIAYSAAVVPEPSADGGSRLTDHEQLTDHERVADRLVFRAGAGAPVSVHKFVGIATSRDPGQRDAPLARATATVVRHRGAGVDAVRRTSAAVWARLWLDSEVRVQGHDKDALALRLGVYHLLIAANPDDPTVSVGAKSLSGEGYRGHVFWDSEILLLPFYLYTQPRTARSLLAYRHHTLPGARVVSAENGTRGARFAWESADTGREECPRWTPDGTSRFWTREEELHVSADVAHAVDQYVAVTADEQFLLAAGAEIVFETSRFWASRLEEGADGRLGLTNVMGPDEFHSHVTDNAFTNRMVARHLEQGAALHRRLGATAPQRLAEIADEIGLSGAEVDGWVAAAARVRPPVQLSSGVIEQFDGYFGLRELPIESWDDNDMPRYPAGYHHFNLEDTTLLKQPDVLMLMYLLPREYPVEVQRTNFRFYEERTLHKSSLSPAIHAVLGLRVGDAESAVRYFERSAYVDLDDNQGNTAEGMHIAAAAGTWQIAVHGFGGMRALSDRLSFDPRLPARCERLQFSVYWRGDIVEVDLGHAEWIFTLRAAPSTKVEIVVDGVPVVLVADDPCTVTPGGVR